MNILSLFDGMSCGRIAIDRAGIKVDKYYASEIDKYAQIVSDANYPDIIRLGDITKWREWDIEQPDIIMGGSPCQGFSFAGKQLNFEDERSKLFFVFVDILKHYKPKYFLLENVIMSKESNDIISRILGELYPECVSQTELFSTGQLEPIEINSALLSAQNRRRLYWTNIQGIEQPEDKGILLKDILENAETEKDKSYCIDANYFKGRSLENYIDKSRRQMVKCGAFRGRNPENPKSRESGLPTEQMLELREDEKTNCLTSVQKDNVIVEKINQTVRVRKYEVDIENLKKTLKENKNQSGLSIKQISKKLNISKTKVEHWFRCDKSFAIPDENIWLNLKDLLKIKTDKFDKSIIEFEIKKNNYDMSNRIYSINGKSPTSLSNKSDYNIKDNVVAFNNPPHNNKFKQNATKHYNSKKSNTLLAYSGDKTRGIGIHNDDLYWRKLTPIECERLQTVPDNFTAHVSNTQRYKMLGNGWTVDVIAHILSYINNQI